LRLDRGASRPTGPPVNDFCGWNKTVLLLK